MRVANINVKRNTTDAKGLIELNSDTNVIGRSGDYKSVVFKFNFDESVDTTGCIKKVLYKFDRSEIGDIILDIYNEVKIPLALEGTSLEVQLQISQMTAPTDPEELPELISNELSSICKFDIYKSL